LILTYLQGLCRPLYRIRNFFYPPGVQFVK